MRKSVTVPVSTYMAFAIYTGHSIEIDTGRAHFHQRTAADRHGAAGRQAF
jgi:hypothetical protein